MIVLLAVVVFVVKFAWLLALIAAVAFVGYSIGKTLARADDAGIARQRRAAELRARADRQNQAFLRGDLRAGIYGNYPPAV